MTRNILIVFGSAYGQTTKIASHIQDILMAEGLNVTLLNADFAPLLDLAGVDGVIVGSSVILGRHRKSVKRFVKSHLVTLNRIPSAFFSVSGSAGSLHAAQQSRALSLMEQFLKATGWSPDLVTTVGGALAYTRYAPLIRWIMKRIARKEGGPTDTTRDHELTNWAHVDGFAQRFARLAAPVLFAQPQAPQTVDARWPGAAVSGTP
jgi:menaquinone-dependent protoporphyrinogen oxidase